MTSALAAPRATAGSVLPSGGGAGAPAEQRGRERRSQTLLTHQGPVSSSQQALGSVAAFIRSFTR